MVDPFLKSLKGHQQETNHRMAFDRGALFASLAVVKTRIANPKLQGPGKWTHGLKPVPCLGGIILTRTHICFLVYVYTVLCRQMI